MWWLQHLPGKLNVLTPQRLKLASLLFQELISISRAESVLGKKYYTGICCTFFFMLSVQKKEFIIFCNGRRGDKQSKLCRESKRKCDLPLQCYKHLPGTGWSRPSFLLLRHL